MSLRKIHLDTWRVDTDPVVETGRPALEGALLVMLGSAFLVNSESDVGHLNGAAECDDLFLHVEDGGLVPDGLVVRVDVVAHLERLAPLEALLGLGLEFDCFSSSSNLCWADSSR